MVYGREKNILGINIFETNIKPDLGLELSIYGALGLDEMYGFNLSIAERKEMSEVIGENEAKALYEELYKQLPRKKNLSKIGRAHV